MDWNSVLIDALSVTSILSVIGLIRFWKQNKKLKNNEVKKDDVETQKAEIDLANLSLSRVWRTPSSTRASAMEELILLGEPCS